MGVVNTAAPNAEPLSPFKRITAVKVVNVVFKVVFIALLALDGSWSRMVMVSVRVVLGRRIVNIY